MKKLIFLGSSVLLLSNVAMPRINAQGLEDVANIKPKQEYQENRISPFALVNAAHKGRLKDWNIPSYSQLQSGYDSGQITALDLINAAIEAGKLLPQAAEDGRYIDKVDAELEQLHED